MKPITKGRVVVTAMVDLAMHDHPGPQISQRQKISQSYLEQVFRKLRRNGLVRSVIGPGGGYHLGRDMAEISVAHIIAAVDRDETQKGGASKYSVTHELWSRLEEHLSGYLASVMLKQLVDEQSDRSSHGPAIADLPRTANVRGATTA